MFGLSAQNLLDVFGQFPIVPWRNGCEHFRCNAATFRSFDVRASGGAETERETLYFRMPREQKVRTVERREIRERLVQLLNQV